MASELRAFAGAGQTLYAHILNSSGQRWNGTAFETYSAGNYANYDIALTEDGSTGAYFGDFPSAITAAQVYEYIIYRQDGGSPATGDTPIASGTVNWNGTSTSPSDTIAGAMSGSDFLTYVKRIFKRTDKDTELYDAITDAIAELRRIFNFDEAHVETTSTDTISTIGDFKIDLETDNGLLLGVTIVDGTNSRTLLKLSKQIFDEYYPNPSATDVNKQKPIHYCVYAGQIQFGPVPDLTTYTYRLIYSKSGATISAATTSVPFTKHYREPLREGTLAKAWSGLDDSLAQEHLAKWEFFKSQMKERETVNLQGTGQIVYNGI